jgi:hypothetical protein
MIAQLFLSSLLALTGLYAWTASRRSPVVSTLVAGAALAGLYFVWLPEHATWIAEAVGIGRGADLVLYVWVVISLLAILNLHLTLRAQLELITVLTRRIAIAEAERMRPNRDRRKSGDREAGTSTSDDVTDAG